MEFRAAVCLSKFFTDERSNCYIHINNTKYKIVGDLEDYLRILFGLKADFCLMVKNYYLPSGEDIKIIQPGENILVVPLNKSWSTCNKENEENIDNDVDIPLEKIKKKKKKKVKQDLESLSQIEEEGSSEKKEVKETKNSKTKHNEDQKKTNCLPKEIEENHCTDMKFDNTESKSSSDDDTDSEMIEDHSGDKELLDQLKNKAISLLGDIGINKQLPGVTGGRINKRKRVRKRNKKGVPLTIQSEVSESTTKTCPTSSYKPMSHIKFYDEEPQVIQNASMNCEKLAKPRIIPAIKSSYKSETTRHSKESLKLADFLPTTLTYSEPSKVICSTPQANSSCNGINASYERTESEGELSFANLTKADLSIKILRDKLSDYPVMDTVLPVPKDVLLFKTLKMDSKHVPTVSDFILGCVLDVEKQSSIIKMAIIDGFSELCCLTDGLCETEITQEESKNFVNVQWTQVLEPRLVFP